MLASVVVAWRTDQQLVSAGWSAQSNRAKFWPRQQSNGSAPCSFCNPRAAFLWPPFNAFVNPMQPSFGKVGVPESSHLAPMQPSFGGVGLPESRHLAPMQPAFGGLGLPKSPHLAPMQPSFGGLGLPESTHLAPMQPAFGGVQLPERTCSSPSHLPSAAAPVGVPGLGLHPRQQMQPSFGTSPQDAVFPAWSSASCHQNSLFGSAVPLGPASQTASAQPSFGFAAEPGNKGVVFGFTAKPGIVTFGQPAAHPQVRPQHKVRTQQLWSPIMCHNVCACCVADVC